MRATGRARVAGVVGRPVAHSLSPLLHGAWIEAAGLDALYAPFAPQPEGFAALVRGLQAGGVRGVNVTLPFKGEALALADHTTPEAAAAGAANVLLFRDGGRIEAHNTDGVGLLAAFQDQAPGFDWREGPVVLLGAGGAAQGAAAALIAAGVGDLRIVNRTIDRARILAGRVGGRAFAQADAASAFTGATAIINATSAGLDGADGGDWPLSAAPTSAVVMDMVYKPLETALLTQARSLGQRTVDGLGMLIGQARPSFEAFFGVAPPASVDVRALLETALR